MSNKNIGDVFPFPLKETQNADVGVIIGRFHVPILHDGHIELFKKVISSHQKVVIFLGLSPLRYTKRNPLDFESRKKMINDKFPEVTILYIMDQYSDIAWSDNLDFQIKNVTGPNQSVVLYGSRYSFIKYYSGRYPTIEVEQTVFTSGTEIRKSIYNRIESTIESRIGIIQATGNQRPKCYPTVDIAIMGRKNNDDVVLLGKRKSEPKYRFIGGFVSPGETFEDAAIRETKEETGLNIKEVRYLKSFVIDDWRYRGEVDKITSSFFTANYTEGKPEPNDDIDFLRWFFLDSSLKSDIVEEHKEMLDCLLKKYRR